VNPAWDREGAVPRRLMHPPHTPGKGTPGASAQAKRGPEGAPSRREPGAYLPAGIWPFIGETGSGCFVPTPLWLMCGSNRAKSNSGLACCV